MRMPEQLWKMYLLIDCKLYLAAFLRFGMNEVHFLPTPQVAQPPVARAQNAWDGQSFKLRPFGSGE